jgi:hypothetical protein
MRRGQTAIEFIILTGFMLFVFTAFFLVIQERSVAVQQQSYYNELSGVANLLSQEVALAQQVRSGYMREFELPPTVNGEKYTVTLSDRSEFTVRQVFADEEYLVFLPVNITIDGNLSGTLQSGYTYTITKTIVYNATTNSTQEDIAICCRS